MLVEKDAPVENVDALVDEPRLRFISGRLPENPPSKKVLRSEDCCKNQLQNLSCFRYWEIRSLGDLEQNFKKSQYLQDSKTPNSESKKDFLCVLCLSAPLRETFNNSVWPKFGSWGVGF